MNPMKQPTPNRGSGIGVLVITRLCYHTSRQTDHSDTARDTRNVIGENGRCLARSEVGRGPRLAGKVARGEVVTEAVCVRERRVRWV